MCTATPDLVALTAFFFQTISMQEPVVIMLVENLDMKPRSIKLSVRSSKSFTQEIKKCFAMLYQDGHQIYTSNKSRLFSHAEREKHKIF